MNNDIIFQMDMDPDMDNIALAPPTPPPLIVKKGNKITLDKDVEIFIGDVNLIDFIVNKVVEEIVHLMQSDDEKNVDKLMQKMGYNIEQEVKQKIKELSKT